jgi:N-acetylgalactosamine PTS system EIIA component
MSETPRALVIGHADFAAGLVSALVQITGRSGALVTMSNTGLGADELMRRIREAVQEHRVDVVFTDLPAGSATLAARRVAREIPLTVVCGASLPVLLEFVMSSENAEPSSIAKQAAERGKAALTVTEP